MGYGIQMTKEIYLLNNCETGHWYESKKTVHHVRSLSFENVFSKRDLKVFEKFSIHGHELIICHDNLSIWTAINT